MSEERKSNVLFPGDEIRIRMSYTHAGEHVAVEAVYVHVQQESYTLTLSGPPELEEGSPTTGVERRSTVILSEVVDVQHIAGRYTLARVLFYLHSGQVAVISAGGEPGGLGLGPGMLVGPGALEAWKLGDDWPDIDILPVGPPPTITNVELETESE